jgi:hypothetical protein
VYLPLPFPEPCSHIWLKSAEALAKNRLLVEECQYGWRKSNEYAGLCLAHDRPKHGRFGDRLMRSFSFGAQSGDKPVSTLADSAPGGAAGLGEYA